MQEQGENMNVGDIINFKNKHQIQYGELDKNNPKLISKKINEWAYMCMNIRGKKILDVGCGNSFLGAFLASNDYDVTILDSWLKDGWSGYCEGTEDYQKQLMETTNTKFNIISDFIEYHDFKDEKFDTILLLCFIEHTQHEKNVLEKCFNLFTPNGVLIITTEMDKNMNHIYRKQYPSDKKVSNSIFKGFTLNRVYTEAGLLDILSSLPYLQINYIDSLPI